MPLPFWTLTFLAGLCLGVLAMSVAFQLAAYKDFIDHLDAEH